MRAAQIIAVVGAGCGAAAGRAARERAGVIEHPALHSATVRDLACDESGSAYALAIRPGASVAYDLLHIEPGGRVHVIDLGRPSRTRLVQDPAGGVWVMTETALHHVRWGGVDQTVPIAGGGRVVPLGADRVMVLRSRRDHTDALLVSNGRIQPIGSFPETILGAAVADGRGGLWAIVEDYPNARRYGGTTPFVHWDGTRWRLWNATDYQGAVIPGPPGLASAGTSPVWTGSVLLPDPAGGFVTPGTRRFVSTGYGVVTAMTIDRDGALAGEAPFIAVQEHAVFGVDVADGSTVVLAATGMTSATVVRLAEGAPPAAVEVRAPAGWRPTVPSSYGVCAAGTTVWVALASAIVGESPTERIELVAPD